MLPGISASDISLTIADGMVSSGSASATVEQLRQAPPPPPPEAEVPPSLRAGIDHWTTTNVGVQNMDGSQTVDMGFNIFNHQYNGNVPASPVGTMMGQRSSTSMEWEHVATPLGNPGVSATVGENNRPLGNPGLHGNAGLTSMPRTNFAGGFGPPQQTEPLWNQMNWTNPPK